MLRPLRVFDLRPLTFTTTGVMISLFVLSTFEWVVKGFRSRGASFSCCILGGRLFLWRTLLRRTLPGRTLIWRILLIWTLTGRTLALFGGSSAWYTFPVPWRTRLKLLKMKNIRCNQATGFSAYWWKFSLFLLSWKYAGYCLFVVFCCVYYRFIYTSKYIVCKSRY